MHMFKGFKFQSKNALNEKLIFDRITTTFKITSNTNVCNHLFVDYFFKWVLTFVWSITSARLRFLWF